MNNNSMSRSNFLRNGLKTIMKFAAETAEKTVDKSIEKTTLPALRPPGAVNNAEFLLNCTRCDECFNACPHGSLKKADLKYGSAAGTPIIIPDETPCYMCEDYPCIKSCPESVLKDLTEKKIGTAYVIKNKCLAFLGQVCDYCYENCPDKGSAITMDNGKPVINREKCSGCGICEYYCPAPGNGITTLPEWNR